MTVEKLCEKLGIAGIVHYKEAEGHIAIERNGRTYLYIKKTGEIIEL